MLRKSLSLLILVALFSPNLILAGEIFVPDEATVQRIKEEGTTRSQVMSIVRYLTDVIGARLTNSPNQRRASLWTKEQFEKWGLKNARLDDWGEFGRGWELKKFYAAIQTPTEYIVFRSYPKAWSPSINITSEVVFVDAKNEQELEQYKGKLKGKIVFTTPEVEIKPGFNPVASRRSAEDLAKMEAEKSPEAQDRRYSPQQMGQFQFNMRKLRFYFEEGAAVLVEPSPGTDSGTIRVMGASPVPQPNQNNMNPFAGVRVYSKNAQPTIPQIVAEVEQYNRVLRLIKQGVPITMTVNLETNFYEDDLRGYNTIAEIPGTDLKDEVVMLGAHLDSWHSGTGATDNAAGSAVVMEAVRILQAAGIKPRRTIRVALWTGEEQGLLGSRGYVAKYLATIGDGSDNAAMQSMMGTGNRQINKKADYEKISAYYNLDNGTGQIRGIYLQGNEALRPIFKKWFEPFKDWGASTVTISSTGGTDHLAFDAVGIPGFQFIQDPIEYFARTWHTTQDVSDRLIEEDLKRSAVIMATFAYNTAMMDEKLPRKLMQSTSSLKLFDAQLELERLAFQNSRLNHSICGHIIQHSEIPDVFPAFLTLGFNYEADEHIHLSE